MKVSKRKSLYFLSLMVVFLPFIFSSNNANAANLAFDENVDACIKRAYSRGGASSKLKLNSGGAVITSSAIPSIVKACNECEDLNWGKVKLRTISALWFTGGNGSTYDNAAIIDSDGSDTVTVYLNYASLSCRGNENIAGTNRLHRHNLNVQGAINSPNGECPTGTTLVNGSTKPTVVSGSNPAAVKVANCKNDGIGNIYYDVDQPVWGYVPEKRLYVPSDDKTKSEVTSKGYITSGYSYTGNDFLIADDYKQNDWSRASTNPAEYTINISSFKNDATPTNHPDEHYTSFKSTVYLYSCSRNAVPGMFVNEEASTYHYGCTTDTSSITINVNDPKLTVKSIDTNGNSISNKISDIVVYGNAATASAVSATRGTYSGYNFKGFIAKSSKDSGNYTDYLTTHGKITISGSGGSTYTESSFANNRTIYAVYNGNVTLTARARPDESHFFKADGTVVSDAEDIWTNKSTVEYGNTAKVSTSSFNPEGYTWTNWGTQGACNGAGANRDCSVNNLTSNTTVNGFYTRNSFRARGRVSNGTSWPGTYTADTGFVKDANTVNDYIECANDGGCTATFWFNLKTASGSGPTKYSIQKGSHDADGNAVWSYVDGYRDLTIVPSNGDNGTEVFKTSENIAIGDYAWYRIAYKPYGDEPNDDKAYVRIRAIVRPSTFIGKTVLSGAASATAGYTSDSAPESISKVAGIDNCSPTSGCKVTFSHYLKRTAGIAPTTYNVKRSSNLITSPRAISGGTLVSDTSFNSNNETVVKEDKDLVLYPGMVVCERLTFKPNNLPGTTGTIYTRVCAHAHGNAQPPGDSDDSALLNIKVKNPSAATKYNSYQDEVYAKPGDALTYRATYNPILQYTYYLKPQKFQINNGTIYENSSSTLGTLFDANLTSGLNTWNNAFSVQKGTNNASYSLISNDQNGKYIYSKGDTTKQQETNNYEVQPADVGKSIDEKALTNLSGTNNSDVRTTPSQVTFSDNNGSNLGNVITAPINDIASAKIPYNFINTTKITSADNLDIYAGESATIYYDYIVGVKPNAETSPNKSYATKVASPKWKLSVKIGNNGWVETPENTASSISVPIDKMYDGTTSQKSTTINIPDVPAGTEICLIPMIYPSNSGADTNYSDKKGSDQWVRDTNTQKCFKVAKKPSIEVWGGNVYSRGGIDTAVAVKNNLEGYTDYAVTGGNNSNKYVFGSWVESGLISNGKVKGLASGAGTGFAANNNGSLVPAYTFGNTYSGSGNNNPRASSPGGSSESTVSFCIRSTLTFANANCGSGTTGNLNSAAANKNVDNDKAAILRKFISTSHDENTSGNVALNDSGKIMENGVYYYYSKSSLNIPSARAPGDPVPTISINKNTIQVVHSDQDITISGNLTYANGDSFTTLEEIPKLIIYAKNVTISCEVARVDALIVADNKVTTCDSDDINSQRNSNQLKVNGAIITNSIDANRTYGAASGANSIIPAEIINYDPSLYLWGGNDRESDVTANNMDVNYTHETSPRY